MSYGVVSSRHPVCSADDREGPAMKLFRYRRPLSNYFLCSTVVKHWAKHELGISQVES